ncbi:MAG: DUF3298 domain-containing protein [Prevotella sp.]|uniref:DUF3298 and DUF4163 domain-containing protein n=1 Tax=Prevotella sp. TaxID=59823 RepID=UPI002A2E0A6D|nr:DUF3298 domain-containing protein [Prevotella sp.]MDD7317201.1 DUF3298 domain-containing protein [Prevotellaceae bacterium]MDY4019805.1 DUF3298 domain-containing protein [Prevotella sp.]
MKKIMFFAAAIALLVACSNVKCNAKGDGNGALERDSVKDSTAFHEGGHDISVYVSIVFPKGNEALECGVTKFIGEFTGVDSTGTMTDVKTIARHYVENGAKQLKGMVFYKGDDRNAPSLSLNLSMGVMYENDRFLTMSAQQETYLGGAHGSLNTVGMTFSKADGKVIGKEILAQDKLNDIRKELTKRLNEMFLRLSDGDTEKAFSLKEDESGKPYVVELPSSGIFISGDDVVFRYQQYEIAPYVFGTPEAKISLQELKNNGWLEAEFAKSLEK